MREWHVGCGVRGVWCERCGVGQQILKDTTESTGGTV